MLPRLQTLRCKLSSSSIAIVILLVASLVLVGLCAPPFSEWGLSVKAQGEYVYYGFVPREVWQIEPSPSTVPGTTSGQPEGGIVALLFNRSVENTPPRIRKVLGEYTQYQIRPGTEMTQASVVVVGNDDGTRVSAYSLPGKELLAAFTVDRLEQRTLRVANASFFKVVADRPVTVLFMGGIDYDRRVGGIGAPFTSAEGGYLGREFTFLAVVPQTSPWLNVRALEDSELTLWDSSGSKVQELKLSANQVKQLPLIPWAVHRLTSTGRVMLGGGGLYLPALNGGFLGKLFFAGGDVVVTGLQDAKITVVDVGYKRKQVDAKLAAVSNLTVQVGQGTSGDIMVESDTPVIAMPSPGTGLGYVGVAAGQSAYIHVPTDGIYAGEAYLYAYKETTVTVDDVQSRLKADEILPLPGGFHRLSASENVLIEVVNWQSLGIVTATGVPISPTIARLGGFATVIPSLQSLSISYQDLRLKPVLEEGLPWMYIAAAGAVLAVGAVTYFLRMRRGSAALRAGATAA